MYKGRQVEVYAESKLAAQEEGAKMLKARKSYDVITVLCEVDGGEVTHTGAEL